MKRAILASILGVAASLAIVSQTHAQGTVFFCNYANGGALQAPVTYSGAPLNGLANGEAVGTGAAGANFTATLLYSYGANLGVTYTDAGVTASFLAANGDTANGAGLFGFLANTVTIPGYTSGNVDFIVQVFNGSSYGNSTIRGQSGVVTLANLATAANALPTGSLLSDNTSATTPLTAFTVSPVPEPTVFALAGLGAAALMVVRRKSKV
jgi:hypothetical protein